jgi:hypothetical protein
MTSSVARSGAEAPADRRHALSRSRAIETKGIGARHMTGVPAARARSAGRNRARHGMVSPAFARRRNAVIRRRHLQQQRRGLLDACHRGRSAGAARFGCANRAAAGCAGRGRRCRSADAARPERAALRLQRRLSGIVLPDTGHPWRVRISDRDTGNILFETEIKTGRINSGCVSPDAVNGGARRCGPPSSPPVPVKLTHMHSERRQESGFTGSGSPPAPTPSDRK